MDGWSFVPLELANAIEVRPVQDLGASPFTSEITVSLTTPAVECSHHEELTNTSAWLTRVNLTDSSHWNASSIPDGLETAYELGPWRGMFFNTTVLTNHLYFQCCTNDSIQQRSRSSALGYWSADVPAFSYVWPFEDSTLPLNFTTKWIHGDLRFVFEVHESFVKSGIYDSIPSAQALHCQPIIESTLAYVTLDPHSGKVNSFSIIDEI